MEEQLDKLPDPALPKVGSPRSFGAELDHGSLTRSPTLAMVGDRCMGFHGGGVELFSSEVISSLKEVGWKEAQCVRRLELQKVLSPWWKESWSGVESWRPERHSCLGPAPCWTEHQGQHTILDGVLGVSSILFSL